MRPHGPRLRRRAGQHRHQLLQPRVLRPPARQPGLPRVAARTARCGRCCESGLPRIIGDLEAYGHDHPRSRSTRLLVREGVRSSLTCPLSVEGRVVGFIFRSSREPYTYGPQHIELQMAITERLSQAVEKAWRIEQLEEANYAYTQMLGFVSHELKSPVASMVTDAQILAQGYLGDLTPEQRAKVESMARKGQYLLSLVREYLDLARVEGGELKLATRSRVDVMDRRARGGRRPGARAGRHARHAPHGLHALAGPAAGVLRPHAAAHRHRQPARQRRQVRQRGRRHPRQGGGAVRPQGAASACGSACGTPGRASTRRSRTSSSAASRAWTTRPSRAAAAPASASTTPGASSTCTSGRITADSKQGEWAEFSFEIPATADCAEPLAVDPRE